MNQNDHLEHENMSLEQFEQSNRSIQEDKSTGLLNDIDPPNTEIAEALVDFSSSIQAAPAFVMELEDELKQAMKQSQPAQTRWEKTHEALRNPRIGGPILAAVIVVGSIYRRWLLGFFRSGIDDWQYQPHSEVRSMLTEIFEWALYSPIMALGGLLFIISLVLVLASSLYLTYRGGAYLVWKVRKSSDERRAPQATPAAGSVYPEAHASAISSVWPRRARIGFGGGSIAIFLLYFAFTQVQYRYTSIQSASLVGPVGVGQMIGDAHSVNLNSAILAESAAEIGFSTGGAKDINNFRENIDNDYLPLPTDITYEGLFYDYYFETGQMQTCDQLFCPAYSQAISRDPLSDQPEHFLAVGLTSGIKESDFARKKLNLVIVLDISGSMGSPFDRYYYDRFGNQRFLDEDEYENKSKMETASEAVVALMDHLAPEDRFGVVLFDDFAYEAKPLNLVSETDMTSIKEHVLALTDRGGTNMEAGYRNGTKLLSNYAQVDRTEYENHIIFLTDAQPNTGILDANGLYGLAKTNADNGIFTTFIGMGVDFNTELIEAMTKIQGANYYSVHSSKQFIERMDEGFDYMVTPLVFDLQLTFDSADFEIMKVNTLFPSENRDGEVKGGLVLLQLKPTNEQTSDGNGIATLTVRYRDRNGQEHGSQAEIILHTTDNDRYDNAGIRKGILLSRYANVIRGWLLDEYQSLARGERVETTTINLEQGIVVLPEQPLSQWERMSTELRTSAAYQEVFTQFKDYFASEMEILGDEALHKELEILDRLIDEAQ
ncbi:VWA domain-containing protein [Chloroflexi bacterium TSY]|nr:VWA domain-containing protein [Chloroflexi bacterium TSY]